MLSLRFLRVFQWASQLLHSIKSGEIVLDTPSYVIN